MDGAGRMVVVDSKLGYGAEIGIQPMQINILIRIILVRWTLGCGFIEG